MITCCTEQYREARFVGSECRAHRRLHICLDPIEVYRRTTPTHACTPYFANTQTSDQKKTFSNTHENISPVSTKHSMSLFDFSHPE